MPTSLLIVEDPKSWKLDLPGLEVVTPKAYLTEERYARLRQAKVFNLCRNYSYQRTGYYVSLLAMARGHRPMPSVMTMQDLRSAPIVRLVSEELQTLIDRCLSTLKSEQFSLSIYFGRNLASRYDRLAQALFNHFPAPLLRAEFERMAPHGVGEWRLRRLAAIAWREIPEVHEAFVIEQAARFFTRPNRTNPRRYRYDIALLVDPAAVDAPSDETALRRFERAARRVGLRPTRLTRADYGRVGEFDALFIRETTRVNHHTYRFASRAEAEGLVVIDDPQSIIRCANKVYLAELFGRHGVDSPRSRVIHKQNATQACAELGLPVVLKLPDSSFSQGVVKASSPEELKSCLETMFATSDLLVAQEYLPSDFDWRIGVLDGRALFACRYYMAKGHWQIQVSDGSERRYGRHEAVDLADVPEPALRLALRATALIGNGLYGVDIKQVGKRFVVIEVNDNPNIDSGVEDVLLKDRLYDAIAQTFVRRIDQRMQASRNTGGIAALIREPLAGEPLLGESPVRELRGRAK